MASEIEREELSQCGSRQPARAALAYLAEVGRRPPMGSWQRPLGCRARARAQLDAPLWHLIGDGCESSHAVEVKVLTTASGSTSSIQHHGLSALPISSLSFPIPR